MRKIEIFPILTGLRLICQRFFPLVSFWAYYNNPKLFHSQIPAARSSTPFSQLIKRQILVPGLQDFMLGSNLRQGQSLSRMFLLFITFLSSSSTSTSTISSLIIIVIIIINMYDQKSSKMMIIIFIVYILVQQRQIDDTERYG